MLQAVITAIPQFLLMAFVVVTAGTHAAFPVGLDALSAARRAADRHPRPRLLCRHHPVHRAPVVTPAADEHGALSAGYRWGLQSPAQIPLALLFGLTAGYREEFFFRSYLLGRMDELGIPVALGVAVSTALFCLGHLYEGPLAVAVTAALGVLLAAAWLRCRNLHVVAIAHGAYNALVLCLGLLLPHTLPDAAGVHIF